MVLSKVEFNDKKKIYGKCWRGVTAEKEGKKIKSAGKISLLGPGKVSFRSNLQSSELGMYKVL